MPVLMMDVARRAGVSVSTVSHVMNETREIAPATRERVMRAIRELNYYKNNSARLLVRGHSDTIGLIISDIENPFLPELVKSFERAASAAGLELLLGMTNYDRKKAEAAVRRMIENRVRG
jgi:LacI family transcriptional regulator